MLIVGQEGRDVGKYNVITCYPIVQELIIQYQVKI